MSSHEKVVSNKRHAQLIRTKSKDIHADRDKKFAVLYIIYVQVKVIGSLNPDHR